MANPRRPLHALAFMLALATATSVAAGVHDNDAAGSIIGRALSPSPLAEDLRHLTDDVGGRVSGTPAMQRAVGLALAAFRAAGVAAHSEGYMQPLTWVEGKTHLELLGDATFPISLVSQGWSSPTPAGGIEAELVYVGDGTAEDFRQAAGRLRGSIVLVRTPVTETWTDLFNEYDSTGPVIRQAIDGGARAILWTSARDHRLLYRHTETVAGELSALPMAMVAREDALRLARMATRAVKPLRVRLTMPNVIGGPVEEHNVVAEIRGREMPNEIVILGAHLDSWDLGTGALDNGCNAALVIAAARAIQESGMRPRRTLRFVLFSGEEQGMLGSRAYVRQHRSELDLTRAMIAIDGGVGRILGFDLSGRDDVRAALPAALTALDGFGLDHLSLDGDFGTDNVDFMLEGVPTLNASQEPATYMQNYHAASDTFDKVDLHQLQQHVAIAAMTLFGIADLPAPLGKRLSRTEISDLLERTGLAKQMQAEGLWDAWVAGQRGREP